MNGSAHGLDRVALVLAMPLLFIVAGGNGYRIWYSGLVPTLMAVPVLLLLVGAADPGRLTRWRLGALWLLLPWLLMFIMAVASWSINRRDGASMLIVGSAYLSPVLLYATLTRLRVDSTWAGRLLAAAALGSAVPLVLGAIEYYREWGFPSAVDLLTSRYALVRMSGYMHATFGNTGSTAAFLSLVIPAMFCAVLNRGWSRWVRAVALAVLVLGVVNAVIVQSRTLVLVLAVVLPAILFAYRVRFAWLALIFFVVSAAIIVPMLAVLDRIYDLTIGAVGGSRADYSVAERTEAMQFALQTVQENWVAGLGPGGTLEVNPFTSAHQFVLQQGSELGIVGIAAAVLLTTVVFVRVPGVLANLTSNQATRNEACFLAGAASFLLYAVIANVPLGENVVNTWAGLCAIWLALAEAVRSRPAWPETRPARQPAPASDLPPTLALPRFGES